MTGRVASVRAREILDSRGRPTVEADVILDDGTLGRASVPSGASVGRHEAHELRDGDLTRHRGLGVRTAVSNVNRVLDPAIRGLDPIDQATVDARLSEADGTPNKARLGANAVLAVSLACARAGANAMRRPLYRHIATLASVEHPHIPLPLFNMISGGLHGDRQLDIQDVMFVPQDPPSMTVALEQATAVHAALGERMDLHGQRRFVADEGGWAPTLASNREAFEWVVAAMAKERTDGRLAIDVAATHFYDATSGQYDLAADGLKVEATEMVDILAGWTQSFPIHVLEDGLAEDDWAGWELLNERVGAGVKVVGDDLFTTNPSRLQRGIRTGVANAILVKPNQIGTLSEALEIIRAARAVGMWIIVSARSGETEDSFLADLAVGAGADAVKVGSITGSSRLAKWNQLLRIEEDLARQHRLSS